MKLSETVVIDLVAVYDTLRRNGLDLEEGSRIASGHGDSDAVVDNAYLVEVDATAGLASLGTACFASGLFLWLFRLLVGILLVGVSDVGLPGRIEPFEKLLHEGVVLLLDGIYEPDHLIMHFRHLRVLFVSETDDGTADIAERFNEFLVGKGVQIDGVNVNLLVVFHTFIISY